MSLEQSKALGMWKEPIAEAKNYILTSADKTSPRYNQNQIDKLYKILAVKKKELYERMMSPGIPESYRIDLTTTLTELNEVLRMFEPHLSNELLGFTVPQGDIGSAIDVNISNVTGGKSKRNKSKRNKKGKYMRK